MSTPILTVGDIRTAIEGREDDEMIHSQVVAGDGTVWHMAFVMAPLYGGRGLVAYMRHPELKTLPKD